MSADDAALVAAARAAAANAYAPYSRFHVGAAVLTADGRLFSAPNIENASYGLSLCAETNAIMAAVAAGARTIARIAVVGYPADRPDNAAPAMPCGRCRQVMNEFATDDCAVIAISPGGGQPTIVAVRDLLPFAFGPADLHD
ncbi:MAG: cytidine deaminase [Acuticoccus sp.]